jgi:hypothetical protein
MNTRGMTTAVLAAGAGSLMIALTACGQSGHGAAVTAPVSDTPPPTPTAAASPTPSAAASPAPTPVAPVAPASSAPSGSATSVDRSIEIYANCTSPSFEPTAIRVTCADGGWSLTDLTWTNWTSARATGSGTLVYNDCKPACVAGHIHQVPGTLVVLSDPQPAVSGQLVWTRMRETPWIPGYATGPMHGEPLSLPTKPI